MHIQVHAKRFPDDAAEREKPYFNDTPAVIPLKEGEVITLTIIAGRDVVDMKIDGKTQMPVSLGEYDYTAFAFVYGPPPKRK